MVPTVSITVVVALWADVNLFCGCDTSRGRRGSSRSRDVVNVSATVQAKDQDKAEGDACLQKTLLMMLKCQQHCTRAPQRVNLPLAPARADPHVQKAFHGCLRIRPDSSCVDYVNTQSVRSTHQSDKASKGNKSRDEHVPLTAQLAEAGSVSS